MAGFDHDLLRAKIRGAAASVTWDEPAEALTREAVAAGEGVLTANGALSVRTGVFTGRSPKDKVIVPDEKTRDRVWWANSGAIEPAAFEVLLSDMLAALPGRALHAQQLFAGADARHAMGITVFTENSWHALFIQNLLIRQRPAGSDPMPVTILHLPSFSAAPARHGTRGATVIALDMSRNIVLIAGTAYAGEIKKAVFSLFNFHAPEHGVLPMHCSANVGRGGDTALFFGLSGTGKTTLSNDPDRLLIGDDEHGWSDDGVFNLEGGCYAKTANLSPAGEPEIFGATQRAGTVLENVVLNGGRPDFDDLSLTENTRAAYPLETLPAVAGGGTGGEPQNVVFLTADAFGVLPPIAKLTREQAVYHFLSGYTAKVAGTERGVTEPTATFSACFGAPFMPLHPQVYGDLLAERLARGGARVWLLNTGWTGGGYGVGKRMALKTTRRLLAAALSGELDRIPMRRDALFGFAVPRLVMGVDPALLDPRSTWADPKAYDSAANRLLALFVQNFEKFGPDMDKVAEGGPLLRIAAQ